MYVRVNLSISQFVNQARMGCHCWIWYLILDHISFTNVILCAFAYQSVYMCGSSLICIFGWLYSHLNSFVTRFVFCLAMQEFLIIA